MIRISIASDHAGYELKSFIKNAFNVEGCLLEKDYGCHSNESMDYPDVVHPLVKSIISGDADMGILICGSANGVAITANKYAEIRAALCWNEEIARLARAHNNANVLCLPARFIQKDDALKIMEAFFSTRFEGGRHKNRVDKINCIL
jgi:ribose 5-phosphate isomerase B